MNEKVRIAALSDIHVHEMDAGSLRSLFTSVSEQADVFVIAGDLTYLGFAKEAEVLANELIACTIPVVAVLGNHDYEQGQQDDIRKILTNAKVKVLDGDFVVHNGIGFAGVKGFGGGFDSLMLSTMGEPVIKQFVHETIEESLKLDKALSLMDTEKKIVLLHYSPIKGTVIGEPEEIFPFLGSSHLSEPINRRGVTAVFHGHAHRGTFEGKTSQNIPVYNVSKVIIDQRFPERKFFVYEL
jgi:Icc-related predicted phosphoesterase